MARPFKNKTVRDQVEQRLDDLAGQTEELRQQVVDRAPAVRDQLVDLLPDRGQLLDLRDDLFERLPDSVSDRLPEQVKPKRSRLKRIAVVGVIVGAGAAVMSVVRGKSAHKSQPKDPFPVPPPAPSTSTGAGAGSTTPNTGPATTNPS